jgi:hypothetical protein
MSVPILVALVVLAVIVVAVAYLLGRYMSRREGAGKAGPLKMAPAQRALPWLFAPPEDREAQAVINWLLTQAFEQTGVRLADDKMAYERIANAARKALGELKSQSAVTISLPFLTADATGPKHFEIRLTRDVIKELVRY